MNLIKPKKLKAGATIGIVALSGAIESEKKVQRAKEYFEAKGYKIVFAKNVFDKKRYLAGEDEAKVSELHRFFADSSIGAILCVRGGYGAIRLLDMIDWQLIKNNPKIFAGYSDVSAMQAMMYKKTGLITFYSPMFQSDFGDKEVSTIVEKSFFTTLTNTDNLEIKPYKRKSKTYFEGKCEGILWGGNLNTIASLCGQDFIPDEKFIFFAEDLNEDTYQIDRLFTQLLNIEKFRANLAGIILGDFLDVKNKKHFDDFFDELGEKYKVPILSGFKISHAKEKITLPNGAMAEFSTEDKILKIEPYLSY